MFKISKISRVSRFLRLLSAVAACFYITLAIVAFVIPVHVMGPWYGTPRPEPASASPIKYQPAQLVLNVGATTPEFRYANVVVAGPMVQRDGVARVLAAFYMTYLALGAFLFFRLFAQFESLRIFAVESVRALTRVGSWMIGLWIASILFQVSKTAFLSNPVFHFDLGVGLLPGLFVLVIAWVIGEGNRLAEDQALTV